MPDERSHRARTHLGRLCLARTLGVSLAMALLAYALLACAPAALALFTDSELGGPLTVQTATLAPPTAVAAAQSNCRSGKAPEVTVSWTATTSTYATSYTIERATSSKGSYAVMGSVAANKTSFTDGEGLAYSTTYYYRVSAVYSSWTAAAAVVSVKTLSKSCS